MPVYVIHGDTVTVHPQAPARVGANDLVIRSQAELAKSAMNNTQLAAIWNALPGAQPLTKFKDRATAARRLWTAFEALPRSADGQVQAGRKAKRRASAGSKLAQVIALLSRPGGASLDVLVKATGWQRHTVRGAIAGTLKKRLGLSVVASKDGAGPRLYRIPR